MNIGLSQRILYYNDIAYDCLEHGWYNLLSDHTLFFVPNNINKNVTDLVDQLDLMIFTGGDDSHIRRIVETKLLTRCYIKNIPILGVCHGALFLNHMEGGINDNIENHHNVEHSIILDNKEYTVNSHHHIMLKHLGDNLHARAWADDGSIEAFRHVNRLMWGTMWHPERMKEPVLPSEIKQLLKV